MMDIKDIKLIKGMNKKEVNQLTFEWIEFLDKEYLGSKHKHNWKCKCGCTFVRDWGKIKSRESIKCEKCVYKYRRPTAIESHKEKVKNTNFIYIKSYFEGDLLENGEKVNKKTLIKIKCKECNTEFNVRVDNFKDDMSICPHCNPYLILPKREDSLAFLFPNIADMIVSNENDEMISYEDCYKISAHSNMKFKFKCKECGKVGDLRSVNQIVQNGYSCHFCSDNKSTPNKFMVELLKILNIDFKSEKTFNWSDKKRYDFYIPSLKMIIEMNGIQHYEECNLTKRTLREEQENDDYKKQLALKNGIERYIIIDCRYSTLEWLKENTIEQLKSIFDLNNIPWTNLWENCQTSLVVRVWELWNKGYPIKEISNMLDIGKTTVARYLHKGNEIGRCKFGK